MSSKLLLTRIDDLLRSDHVHLGIDDECYFVGEYVPRGGYSAGRTNNLISNLKKPVTLRGTPQWHYKERAIGQAASEFRSVINPTWFCGLVAVPMPPSKAKSDPLYDDRMVRIVRHLCHGTGAEVRELIVRTVSGTAQHLTDDRRDADALRRCFSVDEAFALPTPSRVVVVDDVITTGAHFCAAKRVLQERFGPIPVAGLFIARRIIVDEEGF